MAVKKQVAGAGITLGDLLKGKESRE